MKDFSNINHLPVDTKILIANGQALVEEAREKIQDRNSGFDLTSKLQLKADCKEVDKYIRQISSGKVSEKNAKSLELSIIRLQTTLNGLIQFYTR